MTGRARLRPREARASIRALAAAALLAGCAPAMPSLGGGSTTPQNRTDLAAGGAVRVPIGRGSIPEPTAESSLPRSAGAGGAVPVAAVSIGLRRGVDLSLTVAGTEARARVRREGVRADGSTRKAIVYGGGLTGGWASDEGLDGQRSGGGGRIGAELELAYAVDFGGVYEVWIGPRLAADHLRGRFDLAAGPAAARGVALRAGAVLGLALGFRRVHALVELSAYYERFLGEHAGLDLDGGGFVLVPAFALRLRL